MNSSLKKNNVSDLVVLLLYLFFFISLSFSLRAVSSVCIGLLFIAGLIKHKGIPATILWRNKTSFLLIGCILFFLLQFFSLLNSTNITETWKDIQLKSGIVLIPLAVLLSGPLQQETRKKIIAAYCLAVGAAALYCLIHSVLHFTNNGDTAVFFYHEFTRPLHQHAVYFSIFTFIAVVLLLEGLQKKISLFPTAILIPFVIFLSLIIALLSSKLVISFLTIYLAWCFISQARSSVFNRKITLGLYILLFALLSVLLITRNPVGNRFRDILHGSISIIQQDRFTHNDFLNGVQFRLLQWKLVPAILNDQHAWLTGVGSPDAQPLLDKEYLSRNMYPGIPEKGERGYPGFNTHNQLLESLLKNGIPGIIVFSLILFALLKLSWQKKQSGIFIILLLLFAYACVESIFETQYGIVLFTFFPFFLCQEE